MSSWAIRIKSRMKELDMTQEMLANKVGVTRGAITHYLSGRRVPPLKQFQKLAMVLKADPAWLQYGTADNKVLTKKSDKKQKSEQAHRIPLLNWNQVTDFVKGKLPANKIQEHVPHFFSDNENGFALRVKGDSMTSPLSSRKSFHEQEIIIVDPNKTAVHNDYVIALLAQSKEAVFKQFIIEGGIPYLKPLNPQYPILAMGKNVRILGVLIAYLNMF